MIRCEGVSLVKKKEWINSNHCHDKDDQKNFLYNKLD